MSHDIRDFRGTARNPIGRDEYLKKFRSNVGDILSADIVEKTIEDFLKLEKLDDVAPTLARVAK